MLCVYGALQTETRIRKEWKGEKETAITVAEKRKVQNKREQTHRKPDENI